MYLSDSHINESLAKLCGWKQTGIWGNFWISPAGNEYNTANEPHPYPDFCNDLNAVSRAENLLDNPPSNTTLYEAYFTKLEDLAPSQPYIAPAKHRAIALIEVLTSTQTNPKMTKETNNTKDTSHIHEALEDAGPPVTRVASDMFSGSRLGLELRQHSSLLRNLKKALDNLQAALGPVLRETITGVGGLEEKNTQSGSELLNTLRRSNKCIDSVTDQVIAIHRRLDIVEDKRDSAKSNKQHD